MVHPCFSLCRSVNKKCSRFQESNPNNYRSTSQAVDVLVCEGNVLWLCVAFYICIFCRKPMHWLRGYLKLLRLLTYGTWHLRPDTGLGKQGKRSLTNPHRQGPTASTVVKYVKAQVG